MTETTNEAGVSRRTLLKGTAGLAGLAAGSGAITGFPDVMRPRRRCCAISAPP